jgi:hypothetical protein
MKNLKEKYIEEGFILVKNFFNEKEIKIVKKDIEKIFKNYCGKSSDDAIIKLFQADFEGFHGCAKACQNLISLYRMSTSKKVTNFLKHLGLKFPSINTKPLLSFSSHKTAKTEINWKVPAHQDWPSVQGSLNGLTCWIPLVDLNEDLGYLEIAKKSHRRGCLNHEIQNVPVLGEDKLLNEKFTPIKMKLGDLLAFNFFTIHRSGLNKTKNEIRITTHFRYNDLEEETFIQRKLPHHRVDTFKAEILFPDFPNQKQMKSFLRKQIL